MILCSILGDLYKNSIVRKELLWAIKLPHWQRWTLPDTPFFDPSRICDLFYVNVEREWNVSI